MKAGPGDPAWRRVARALRHLPDRLLHTTRRRRVIDELRGKPRPQLILVVCHGNICRSPYADRVLAREIAARLPDPVEVRSAGFGPPGCPSPESAVRVALERGVELAQHRSRQLSLDVVGRSELTLVMDATQKRLLRSWYGTPQSRILVLGDLDPHPVLQRGIQDPFGHDDTTFRAVFARLDRCVEALVGALAGSRTSVASRGKGALRA